MTDDIADRIARLKASTESNLSSSRKEDVQSKLGRTATEVASVQKFLFQVTKVLIWLWWNVGNPVMNMFTMPVFKWVWYKYRALWNRFAMKTDEYGARTFSVRRGAMVIVLTAMSAYLFVDAVELTWDIAVFATTVRTDETVYLFRTDDNSFTYENDDFSVSGCEITAVQAVGEKHHCSDNDSLYFRLNASLFNNMWSMITHRNIFAPFLPDYVAAAVSTGWNQCKITTYGFRARFFRFINWYPELLSTDCVSV